MDFYKPNSCRNKPFYCLNDVLANFEDWFKNLLGSKWKFEKFRNKYGRKYQMNFKF